ncbi:MAG TPA: tripartite tricarboxylate transporter substrate binding protein, partial [Burkholderiales bacterium]|nr:tripartite tricarboxylate transporter substrate binding protein [Burkholderiales bacterium]
SMRMVTSLFFAGLRVLCVLCVSFAALFSPVHAQPTATGSGQAYPSKIVRVVIPWPGGSNDAAGRVVFQKVAESVGQPVVIDNRPGAAGTIGATLVARSAADGYTVMVTSASIVSNAHLYKKLPYDTLKDFSAITPLAAQVGVLVVHPSLPAKTVKELIAFVKKNPNQILYGSSGSGSFLHLAMAHFDALAATRMIHVPYKGGDAAGVSLIAGETQAMIATTAVVMPLLPANRVRVLGVTSDKRIGKLPDVPTLAEAGVPGYEFTAWVGAFVPAGTPRVIIDKLSVEIKKALDHPDVTARFNNIALEPMFMTPEQFATRIKSDYNMYAKLIALTGVQVN